MFIKKASEFTGLWVSDKWKGYTTIVIENFYQRIINKYMAHHQLLR